MDGKHLIFFLPFSLSVGLFWSLAFLRQKTIERLYFRNVALGSALITFVDWIAVGSFRLSLDVTFWVVGFCLLALTFSLTLGKSRRISTAAFFLAILCGMGALVMDADTLFLGALSGVLVANEFITTLVLGFSAAACLLLFSHRAQTPFPERELTRTTLLLLLSLIVRLCYTTFRPAVINWIVQDSALLSGIPIEKLILGRWIASLVFPVLVLLWMVLTKREKPGLFARVVFLILTFGIFAAEALGSFFAFVRANPI